MSWSTSGSSSGCLLFLFHPGHPPAQSSHWASISLLQNPGVRLRVSLKPFNSAFFFFFLITFFKCYRALQLGMGFILLMRPISKMAPTAPSCSHTHHLLLSDAYLLVLFWKKKRQPDISGSTEEVDRQPEEKWS